MQPQQRTTGRQVTHRERGKGFHKGQKCFPLFCPPPASRADSAGVCSARCMGDAWSAGSLLRAQVRQQGLSWQQPGSTIRPGPGPWQDLPDLLCELLQGRVRVVRLLHKLQVPLLSFLQVLPCLISLPGHLLHLLPAERKEGSLGTLLWA